VDPCLDLLERRGLLDDDAVAAAFVRDRLHHRPRGRARLSSELRAKGITPERAQHVVDRVLSEEEVTDASLAREVANGWLSRQGPKVRRALSAAPRDPERERARRRLYAYLARRGFGGDALRGAMASVLGHT
jgi:SOS response regulatory protein OraA/RecX